ncbi:phosphatidylglycerophosphate synthase [Streptosporangium jomthongense]|uniref:CDP-diacylglycerol--glycerol-3-phosphate 3-phosphatidyltransferase n=1 Tax=Marinobacter aromaticivorans TaxID=1494078 RepID=A0ABW2IXG3_9GAMM|nr:CDP-alcohol phosphatidyltransferase family protein [Marinobacter aromaticivorans]GGE71711.1 phosphatidylglycerophosphate synthase [Streptosporangium jomthongense]
MNSHAWRWVPNALTLVRILLIAPFARALLVQEYRLALTIFAIASLTDGLDGFLARRFNWRSRFGAVADPLADKGLLITAYLVLTYTSVLPLWLFALVLGRDLLIVGGALVYHYCIGRFDMQPSVPGKLNTLVQILVILGIIIILAGFPAQPVWLDTGIWLVAASTVFSGVHYVIVWGLRAWRSGRQ